MSERPMILPPGWSPRSEQLRVFHAIIDSFEEGKKVVIVQAPTGMGKSGVAYGVMRHFKTGAAITATKQLQEQYEDDFQDVPRIMGRGNFECNMGAYSCEKGYYIGTSEKKARSYCEDCPFRDHVDLALNSSMYVANYPSYFYTAQGDPTPREVAIYDEGHRIEAELMNMASVEVTEEWIKRTGAAWPEDFGEESDLFDWLEGWYEEELSNYYSTEYAAERDRLKSSIKYLLRTREKLMWVAQLSREYRGRDWISFKPLRLSRYFTSMILERAPRLVIMSATILNPRELARSLCLRDDEWSYVESTHSFDPRTRPVLYLEDSMPVTRATMDDAQWCLLDAIQSIMEEHPEDKGLIHTSSTRIARFIAENIRDDDERILLAHGRRRMKAYRQHIESKEPTILVSPSMTEGVDLRDDLARFLVLAKAPFMSLGDLQVARRAAIDDDWYKTHTVRQIIQAAGRGNRSATDYCVTYVLDEKIKELLEDCEDIVPQWFWESWETI